MNVSNFFQMLSCNCNKKNETLNQRGMSIMPYYTDFLNDSKINGFRAKGSRL